MTDIDKRSPSTVFLSLWRYWTKTCEQEDPAAFLFLADTWAQIRELENEARWDGIRKAVGLEAGTSSALLEPSPQGEGSGENVSGSDTPESPKRDNSEIGKAAFATRKRKILETVDRLRAEGATLAEIADGAKGLTLPMVMDAIDRKPLPVTTWTLIEKAVKKLEASKGVENEQEGGG